MKNTKWADIKYTDVQVLDAVGKPPLLAVLRSALLAYLIWLVLGKHPVVRRLVALTADQPNGWCARLTDALESVFLASPATASSMPSLRANLVAWLNAIDGRPQSWAPVFRQHRLLASAPTSHAASVHQASDATHVCRECNRAFIDLKAYNSHLARKHGYINFYKLRLCSTICFSCSRDFHEVQRIFVHVAYSSKICRHAYDSCPGLDPEVVAAFWSSAASRDSKLLKKPPEKI